MAGKKELYYFILLIQEQIERNIHFKKPPCQPRLWNVWYISLPVQYYILCKARKDDGPEVKKWGGPYMV